MRRIKLTGYQLSEIAYKISIICDSDFSEGTMAHHYGLTPEMADALWAKVSRASRRTGEVEFTDIELRAVIGEVENALDIAEDNLRFGDRGYLSAVRSLRLALHKLTAAQPEAAPVR